MKDAGILTGKVSDFEKQLKDDFADMAVSVAKYGGFFVSRYEMGVDGASKKNQIVLVAGTATDTNSDANTFTSTNLWYGLYKNSHKEITVNSTPIFQSHMIYGSQYDQIINFIGTNAQRGHSTVQLTQQKVSGFNENDIMKNIFDLEGNNMELTAERCNNRGRTPRGGWFAYAGLTTPIYFPASIRNFHTNAGVMNAYSFQATRSALFFK